MSNRTANLPEENVWQSELKAGITAAGTLLAGFVVVPNLLMQAGMNFTGAYTAYAITALLGTLCMAWLRLPLLLAPETAAAGWLVCLVSISQGVSWQQLLGITAAASLVGAGLWMTTVGHRIADWLPETVRQVLPGGFGLMLILMGLSQGRLVISSPWSLTMLGNFQDPLAYFGLLGIIITLALLAMKVRGGLLYGMLVTAVLALLEGFWVLPEAPFLLPEGLEYTAGQLNLLPANGAEAARLAGTGLALLLVLSSLNFGSLQALCPEADKDRRVLPAIFGISLLGSLLGSLPVTIAPASAGAVMSGGRGRLTAVFAAGVLLLALCCEPVLACMADFPVMTVPVLTVSGLLLLQRSLQGLYQGTAKMELVDIVPAACLIIVMPLSWNIAAGLGTGILSWCLMSVCAGQVRRIPWGTWLLAAVFLLYFLYGSI